MLDKRAWIIACVIVLLGAGSYVIWLRRARAVYSVRSLSASRQPANAVPERKTLHVEGCKEDFIVTPGEIVEPKIAPGATLEQFRGIYGPESKSEKSQFVWDTNAFQLTTTPATATEPDAPIQIALNGGHVVETLDGIELGLDSFGTVFRKMRDRKVEVHERILRSGDQWILTVSLFSSCGRRFRSEYSRGIPSDPLTDSLINRRSTGTNGQPGPLRSDVFMNKVSYAYVLKNSNGRDDSAQGEPSEHN